MQKISPFSRLGVRKKTTLTAWLLLAPTIFFLLAFTVFPIIRSIYFSFHQYELGMKEPVFNGAKNFIKLFSLPLFWKIMGQTLFFSLITVLPSMAIGLGLALLVNRKIKGTSFFRASYFYPVIMPMIGVASIWMFIYMAKNGLLDQFIVALGGKPLNILSNKNTVLPALGAMYVWKEAGYLMIFFLSGLQNISEELYEAALIDGANKWKSFLNITLPMLAPTVLFVSTVALTNSVKLVDHIAIMTEGAPNNASTLLMYYLYQQGFVYFDQGMASTVTVVMLAVMLSIAMLQFLKTDDKIHYGG